jgi:hypothetical protein
VANILRFLDDTVFDHSYFDEIIREVVMYRKMEISNTSFNAQNATFSVYDYPITGA